MVKQGSIIKLSFDPHKGREQAGYRPALIVSNDDFYDKTHLCIACPITTNSFGFPLHVELDGRTKTSGFVMCEQIKTIDINARKYKFIEHIPKDKFEEVKSIILAEL